MHKYEGFWMWIGTSSSEQPTAHIYPEGSCIRFVWNLGAFPSNNI